MVDKMADALRVTDWTLNRIDPDGLRHVATVSVRVHWFIAAVVFLEVMYRPYILLRSRHTVYRLTHTRHRSAIIDVRL